MNEIPYTVKARLDEKSPSPLAANKKAGVVVKRLQIPY